TASAEIYTLSLHDALPILRWKREGKRKESGTSEGNGRRAARGQRTHLQVAVGNVVLVQVRHGGHNLAYDVSRVLLRVLASLHDRSEEHTSELQSRENLVCR